MWKSILGNAHANDKWAVNGRPGHYNDADMLEVGNGKSLTLAEQRSHFVRMMSIIAFNKIRRQCSCLNSF